jgi:glutaredoxin-related protein
MLCDAVQKRIPERVSLELRIKRPNVYPYMKGRKKRLVPNAETTARIINALRYKACSKAVLTILEPAMERMRISVKAYQNWMRGMKGINNPFSEAEIERLEWSLSPRRMHF